MTEIVRVAQATGARTDSRALTGFGHLRDVLALDGVKVDVTCTECGKKLRDVPVLKVLTSRPCPLCASCRDCAGKCLTGEITHGVTEEFFHELKALEG